MIRQRRFVQPLEPRRLLSAGQLDKFFGDGGYTVVDLPATYFSNITFADIAVHRRAP